MKILGKGFHGVVLQKSDTVVRKYYTSKEEWTREIDSLKYLSTLDNLNIGCIVPVLHASGKEVREIDNITYSHWTEMQLIQGEASHMLLQHTTRAHNELIGKSVARVLYRMQLAFADKKDSYVEALHQDEDHLYTHIFKDKLALVLKHEADNSVLSRVKEVADYLSKHEAAIREQNIPYHCDLNLNNIIVNEEYLVEGLVDWASFGLTHPSIALYQLAKEDIWPFVEKEHEAVGGTIQKDLMYAATVIHLAWSKIYWQNRDNKRNTEEAASKFDRCYPMFRDNMNE